jgi:hypothetical protein
MTGQELEPQTKTFVRSKGRGWGVQCKAHRRDGARCTRWAIVGGYVCPKHGGSAPQVRAGARARLRALAPMAVDVIATAMTEGKPAEQLRAARFVLKYSGITPANIRAEAKSRGERAALPQGAPVSTDDEIERLLEGLRHGEAAGLEGGDQEAPALEA